MEALGACLIRQTICPILCNPWAATRSRAKWLGNKREVGTKGLKHYSSRTEPQRLVGPKPKRIDKHNSQALKALLPTRWSPRIQEPFWRRPAPCLRTAAIAATEHWSRRARCGLRFPCVFDAQRVRESDIERNANLKSSHAREQAGLLPIPLDVLHSNCNTTISGFEPRRSGGPQVPAPLEVNTCILPIRLSP